MLNLLKDTNLRVRLTAASAVLITSPESEKYIDWNLSAAARYPLDCKLCPQGASVNGSTQSLIVPSTIGLAQTEKISLSPFYMH